MIDTDSSVISALISGGLALIGTFGGILAGNKLTTYRISELEKKVDKHNNLVERMYHLEEKTSVQEEQLKIINHRIADLESERKELEECKKTD